VSLAASQRADIGVAATASSAGSGRSLKMAKKSVDRPQRSLAYQVDWPASIRRVDERTFEHVVANDCVLSMLIDGEPPPPAHKLVAKFHSSGVVTALLSGRVARLVEIG